MTHFCEGFNVQPFLGMEWKVQPHALAWMANECDLVEGEVSSPFFEYIRGVPGLFDAVGGDQEGLIGDEDY